MITIGSGHIKHMWKNVNKCPASKIAESVHLPDIWYMSAYMYVSHCAIKIRDRKGDKKWVKK